ncbi:MAG: hypothetical protein NT027_13150, partial [Proteobacteria bacterium]|nr:hypothetical protein [Pseudomonadota bacterium]
MKHVLLSGFAFLAVVGSSIGFAGEVVRTTFQSCGSPYTHYPLSFDEVCEGYTFVNQQFVKVISLRDQGIEISSYTLTNSISTPSENSPKTEHKLVDALGEIAGESIYYYEVEDGRYPGDGERRLVSMKILLSNGT